MDKQSIRDTISKIFNSVFEKNVSLEIDEVFNKFAFDINLPVKVKDSLTGEETWSIIENADKYIKQSNMEHCSNTRGWMFPKKDLKSLEEVIQVWEKSNFITTERLYNSTDCIRCDTIYSSNNIYHSVDLTKCSNSFFCDGCRNSELMIASQRTSDSINCIRVDDSSSCSNSYNVICSGKIANSYFIQDCSNLYECMFCSHISDRKFCISNMQYEEEEYFQIKKIITEWILK